MRSAYKQRCRETYSCSQSAHCYWQHTRPAPTYPYDSLIDMRCLTSCCSKLQAALPITCLEPLTGVMETSWWKRKASVGLGYKLQQQSSSVTWRRVSSARRLSDSSGDETGFSDDDLTDIIDLPTGMTSNQLTRHVAIDHHDKQLQTSLIRSCPLAGSEWLEMLRRQVMQIAVKWARRQTTMPVQRRHPIPSRWLLSCRVWTLSGITWRQLAASPISVHAAGLATLKSIFRT